MKKKWVVIPLGALLVLVGFIFQFYRDPERVIPSQGVVSPADGKIIAVEHITAGTIPIVKKGEDIYLEELQGLIREDSHLIAIFMSPTDVHVNRSPIRGVVTSIIYIEGGHAMASKLALTNERNIIVIDSNGEGDENKNGEIRMIVIQIAGKVARRICCFVKEGTTVEKGERIGRIALGSQVVLILPSSYTLCVKPGDHVKAGETIVAQP